MSRHLTPHHRSARVSPSVHTKEEGSRIPHEWQSAAAPGTRKTVKLKYAVGGDKRWTTTETIALKLGRMADTRVGAIITHIQMEGYAARAGTEQGSDVCMSRYASDRIRSTNLWSTASRIVAARRWVKDAHNNVPLYIRGLPGDGMLFFTLKRLHSPLYSVR